MKKQIIYLIGIILIISYSGNLFSQLPKQKSFYEIQNQHLQKWQGKDISKKEVIKGKGYKQFKRWENFMEPRVFPDGYFNKTGILWDESQKLNLKKAVIPASNKWEPVGPNQVPGNINDPTKKMGAGRIDCMAFHPTDSNTFYVGTPSGGVWRTKDNGNHWEILTDKIPNMAIADIEIDPSNPDIIYIATGDRDTWPGDDNQQFGGYSVGILKTTNAGTTWELTGLNYKHLDNIQVNEILLNPQNPQILIAGTSLGIFRSSDGGTNWLPTGITSNVKDMKFHPTNENIIYAATSDPYGLSHILKSTNGGISFSVLSNTGITNSSRIELAVTKANPDAVFALSSTYNTEAFGGLYKSSDTGNSWTVLTPADKINLFDWEMSGQGYGGQGYYDMTLAIHPKDENHIRVGAINIWESTDGGNFWNISTMWYQTGYVDYVHADQHVLEYHPITENIYAGNDGGIYTFDKELFRWSDISNNLSILQIYRLGVSPNNSELVLTGNQDNGTYKKDASGLWYEIVGGDGMECLFDYTNDSILYAEYYYGNVVRSMDGGQSYQSITPTYGNSAWITPYVIHPTDPKTLYLGGNGEIYKTTNRGDIWNSISYFGRGNFQSLAISSSNPDYLYAATFAEIFVSSDGGTNWNNITEGLPKASITYIAISDKNPNHVWVSLSGFLENEKVYYSADGGQNWTNYSTGLPNVPSNCIVYQQNSDDAVYLATDLGVYFRNASLPVWIPFNNGLPAMIVSELEIHNKDQKIFGASYGRGLWSANLYNPQDIDLGITAIISPVSGSDLTNTETVVVQITNFGNIAQSNFEVNFQLNKGVITTETFTGTILPGESVNYSFTQKTDISAPGIHILRAYTSVQNDNVQENNAVESEIKNYNSNQNPENGEFALNFRYQNHYINCGHDASINIEDSFTAEAWINPVNYGEFPGAGFGRILDKQNMMIFTNGSYPFYNLNSLIVVLTLADGTRVTVNSAANTIKTNVWQHIAVVYNSASGVRIFVNGAEQETMVDNPIYGALANNANADLIFGERATMDRAFNGLMDEVRLWNTIRTPDEIRLNQCTVDPNTPGLAGYWRFNEGPGSLIAIDQSTNNNHGILHNFNVNNTPNTDWVESSRSCFENDLSIVKVIFPQTGPSLTNSEIVTVKLHNAGNTAQSNFELSYSINGQNFVSEQFTNTISPRSEADFSFAVPADFSQAGIYEIHAAVSAANDMNTQNDTLVTSILHDTYCKAFAGLTTDIAHIHKVNIANNTFTSNYNGYSYQPQSIELHLNKSYEIDIVALATAELQHCAVAIDWNADNDFDDEGEFYPTTRNGQHFKTTVIGNKEGLITQTRMRIVFATNISSLENICGNHEEGEVEDYHIQTLAPLSDEAEIISFTVDNQIGETEIDAENGTVLIYIPKSIPLWPLMPYFTLSNNAKAYVYGTLQVSGVSATDFSSEVEYMVMAEDETHFRTWRVKVRHEQNDQADFVGFSIPGQITVSKINKETREIDFYVSSSADLTALVPFFQLSSGATTTVNGIEQISGETANNFSNQVVYNVLSENQLVNKEWTVKVATPVSVALNQLDMVKIYPNPAQDYLILENAKGANYEIIGTDGKMIFKGTVQSLQHRVDISTLEARQYVIRIISGKMMYNALIMIID